MMSMVWFGLGLSSMVAIADGEAGTSDDAASASTRAIASVAPIVAMDPFALPSMLEAYQWNEAARAEYLRIAHQRPGSEVADRALYLLARNMVDDYGTSFENISRFYGDVSHADSRSGARIMPRVSESMRDEFFFLSYHSAYLSPISMPGVDECFFGPFCGPESEYASFVVPPELTEWAAEVHYMAGWVALSKDRTEDAMAFFGQVDDPYLLPSSREVMAAIDARDLPHRSRALAGVLAAIVPGSGHLYAGSTGPGLMTALTTGLMGYLAWDAHSRDNRVQLAIFSVGGVMTHAMFVMGAVELVDRFNDQQVPIWLADLEPAHHLSATLETTEGERMELRLELETGGDCESAGPEWNCSTD